METPSSPDLNRLCLQCGLCCNGVIFARGELQPGDETVRAKAIGLKLLRPRSGSNAPVKFQQPCVALNGCRCTVYADRPLYCRQFECLLFSRVQAGEVIPMVAERLVRKARKRVARIVGLMEALGETRTDLPLMTRYGRVQQQLERSSVSPEMAALFADLSCEVHALTLLLAEEFYPG